MKFTLSWLIDYLDNNARMIGINPFSHQVSTNHNTRTLQGCFSFQQGNGPNPKK